MNKDRANIKPAKDYAKKKAVEYIADKYHRSVDWGYKVARKDAKVQDGEYFKEAFQDFVNKYKENVQKYA